MKLLQVGAPAAERPVVFMLATVAGYVVSHDVSERMFQLELSPQWDLGKSCETFNPLGSFVAVG